MSHPFVFRPNTEDEQVFHAVNTHNEYRLPDSFRPEDVIIDVGAHIGSFCYAALIRGSDRVHGFEACEENYVRARANLATFGGRVRLEHRAVWRSDRAVDRLGFTPCEFNNGAGIVWKETGGRTVGAVRFDDVVRQATRGGRDRVRLLKLDCEGSEYPILLTSRTLHLVDAIVGEFHELGPDVAPHGAISAINRVPGYDRFTVVELKGALERAGFDVEVVHHPVYPREPIGWWFAARKAPAAVRDGIPAPKFSRLAALRRKVGWPVS